jgi:o-succinylbenzoate synthase
VRITAARLQPYAMPLKAEWLSAAGTVSIRSGWLLRIETDTCLVGYGECAPLPSHGTENAAASERAMEQWVTTLPGQIVETALAELAAPGTFATPAARAAVEGALLDLLAQQAGLPLAAYLCQHEPPQQIKVNAMLGAAITVGDAAIADAVRAGFCVIKLKVGLASVVEEIDALRRIASLLPTGVALRLDANRAWTMADAEIFCAALTGLPIESLEEPLAQPGAESLRALGQALPFRLALDESWHHFAPESLFEQQPVRLLVLKLAPCGGLLPAWNMAQRAAAAGIECVVTTGLDSTCGTLAAAHLAAAIDRGSKRGLAHGLATSAWLNADTGEAPIIDKGCLQLPEGSGLGFRARAGVFS